LATSHTLSFCAAFKSCGRHSAAHRKGSNYDKLIADFQMADEGQQRVFAKLLVAGSELIRYLDATLLPKATT
jgi:hypothetical protein